MAKARRATKSETIVAALKAWDQKDEALSELSDPLKQQGPSDEVVRLWEQDFYTHLMNDREYWIEREARLRPKRPSKPGAESFFTRPSTNESDTISIITAKIELAIVTVPYIIAMWIDKILRRHA